MGYSRLPAAKSIEHANDGEEPPMPKPAEIVAALGDVSAIDSYATLRSINLDHPDTQKAVELIKVAFDSM